MKVIHFAYTDEGGAGIAAVRYHQLMKEMGIDSKLYVSKKVISNDESVISIVESTQISILRKIINKCKLIIKRLLGIEILSRPKVMYCYYDFNDCNSSGMIPDLLTKIDCEKIDFIFIHWLGGFINTYDIKNLYNATKAKVIYSMMDLEPITGGCHYPWKCNKFENNCLDCPALPGYNNLISHNQLMTKATNLSYINADIYSSSLYDLEQAKKSIIPFSNYHQLYYPIDDAIFTPAEKVTKETSEEVTLFANVNSVGDCRKGFNYLLMVLLNLDKKLTKKVRFLCLHTESYKGYEFNNVIFEEFSFCKNVNDLVALYNKTDIFLCASIEDSSPMMLQEALLCGVPAITFDTGVGKQFIENGKQGYVVPRYDVKSFEEKLFEMIECKSSSIQSPKEIHDHMVKICGKEQVKNSLNNIFELYK